MMFIEALVLKILIECHEWGHTPVLNSGYCVVGGFCWNFGKPSGRYLGCISILGGFVGYCAKIYFTYALGMLTQLDEFHF